MPSTSVDSPRANRIWFSHNVDVLIGTEEGVGTTEREVDEMNSEKNGIPIY